MFLRESSHGAHKFWNKAATDSSRADLCESPCETFSLVSYGKYLLPTAWGDGKHSCAGLVPGTMVWHSCDHAGWSLAHGLSQGIFLRMNLRGHRAGLVSGGQRKTGAAISEPGLYVLSVACLSQRQTGLTKEGTASKQTPLHFVSCFQTAKEEEQTCLPCACNERACGSRAESAASTWGHCRGGLEREPGRETVHRHTRTTAP